MSADSLNYCAKSGLISELIGELTGDDVLVRYVGSEFANEISPVVKTPMFSVKIKLFKHVCVSCETFSGKDFICFFLNSLECKILYT